MVVLIRSHRQYPKLLANETHVDKFIGFLRDFSNLLADTDRGQRKAETAPGLQAKSGCIHRDIYRLGWLVSIFRDKRSRLFPINWNTKMKRTRTNDNGSAHGRSKDRFMVALLGSWKWRTGPTGPSFVSFSFSYSNAHSTRLLICRRNLANFSSRKIHRSP